MRDRAARIRSEKHGRWAESLAALYLRLKGYRILGRRLRTAGGEIDILARQGDTLVFVEVKKRMTLDNARKALHPAQKRRMEAASRRLVSRYGRNIATTRLDAVLIGPWGWPEHLIAVWREGE
ncbi:YraN family protein [Polymorphobacter sp.]|uniref:YraN family protein n=1 Tax=Polymorphobacter sp. TaxID=1909290 RepID=UPI003F6FD275